MKKMRRRRLNKTKLVKEMARDRIGTLPRAQVIPDKRHRPTKHKKREGED